VKDSSGSSYFTVDANSAPGLKPGRRGFVGIEASCFIEVAFGVEGFGVFAMTDNLKCVEKFSLQTLKAQI